MMPSLQRPQQRQRCGGRPTAWLHRRRRCSAAAAAAAATVAAAAGPRRLQPNGGRLPASGRAAAAAATAAGVGPASASASAAAEAPGPIGAPLPPGEAVASFAFWHDEKRFRGVGDDSLAQQALLAAGGVRVGGNFKRAAAQGPMGWQVPDRWDVLWSTSDGALKAAHALRPGQLVSALPGVEAVTKKRNLAITLAAAYGDAAWELVPRTYSLPAQLQDWRQRLCDEAAAMEARRVGAAAGAQGGKGSGAAGRITHWWALKTAEHLGAGLSVVPSSKALSALVERNAPYLKPPGAGGSGGGGGGPSPSPGLPRPFICAQQYVTSPLLISGRKFGLRCWVLARGPAPFRAYLHVGGLVLFSSQQYNADLEAVQAAGAATQGHLTNAALNRSGEVWPLERLLELLGEPAAARLRAQLARKAARVVAAAAGSVRQAAADLQLPPDCAFELLGLDFLVDSDLEPWVLEANASPSLACEHDDAATEQAIRAAKERLLADTLALLRLQDRFPPAPAAPAAAAGGSPSAQQQQQQQQVQVQQQQVQPQQQGQRRQQQVNPLLRQSASAAYFAARPHVRQLVLAAADRLRAVVEATPRLPDVRRRVEQALLAGATGGQDGAAGEPLLPHAQRLAQLQAELESSAAAGWVPLFSGGSESAGGPAGGGEDELAQAHAQLRAALREGGGAAVATAAGSG